MKRTLAFLALSVLVVQAAHAAQQPAPAISSACVSRTALVTALDGDREARTYAVAFQGGEIGSKPLSGTVTMYVGDDRYDFAFHDVKVDPVLDPAAPTPVVVRFPSAGKLDAVYLSSIDGPYGGPCALTSSTLVLPEFDDAYTLQERAFAPLDAPAPVHEPAICPKPYVPAHSIKLALLGDVDRSLTGADGALVHVRVHLAPDGSVIDVAPLGPRAPEPFERAALASARTSTYTPEIVRCKAVEGGYTYIALFAPL